MLNVWALRTSTVVRLFPSYEYFVLLYKCLDMWASLYCEFTGEIVHIAEMTSSAICGTIIEILVEL